MSKIIEFPKEKSFNTTLIKGLEKIGYNDEEIKKALQFVKDNPINQPVKNNVIPFPKPTEPEMGKILPFKRK